MFDLFWSLCFTQILKDWSVGCVRGRDVPMPGITSLCSLLLTPDNKNTDVRNTQMTSERTDERRTDKPTWSRGETWRDVRRISEKVSVSNVLWKQNETNQPTRFQINTLSLPLRQINQPAASNQSVRNVYSAETQIQINIIEDSSGKQVPKQLYTHMMLFLQVNTGEDLLLNVQDTLLFSIVETRAVQLQKWQKTPITSCPYHTCTK